MDNSRKKKILIKAVVAVVLTLALLAVISAAMTRCEQQRQTSRTTVYSYDPFAYKSDIGYYTPAEGEDIMQDEEFLEKNRYISVEHSGIRTVYTEQELDDATAAVKMFSEYFKCATAGDGKTLNTLFTDAYFANYDSPLDKYEDTFYQQKIFDIRIRLVEGPYSIPDVGGTISRELYEVSFKILDNNGAFRPDLPEPDEGTIPLVYEVLTQNGEANINGIILYSE